MSSWPSYLDLRLLGPPQVLVDGNPASMDTRKATALLAYLAVTGTAWPRDHLVELLWPDQDPVRSRAVFRRTLSSLRGALGGRWVEADRETVRFDGTHAAVDVHQALELATVDHGHQIEDACPDCIHPLGQAESLFGGDDAHWLDHATTRLLAYMGRRRHRWPFLIALAYRAEDLDHRHPLGDIVEESDYLLEPDRLSSAEIADLIEQMGTPGPFDPEEVRRRTGGLPLLVTDVLESGSVDGVSETVRRAVAFRLEDVSSLATQLLTAAAVLGAALDPDLLQTVSGREPDETADAIDELIRRGLLQAAGDRLDFGHALIRDIAYQQATPVRLRLLHRRAAEAFAKSRDDASAGMVARHLERAGEDEAAARAHRHAGDVARSVYASAEAVGHYQSALALGHPEVAGIRIALGELAMLAGEYRMATDHFGAAAVRGAPQEMALAEHRMGEVERRLGNWDSAERSFRAAEKDHPQPADLYADWALLQYRRGDLEGASRWAARSLQYAEEGDSPLLRARALNITGVVETDLERARTALEASLREAGDDAILRMAALNNLAALARRREESEEARHHLEEALGLAVTVGDRHRQAAILDELAGVLRDLAMVPESEERQRRAVELFADIEAASGERRPEIWLLSRW